MEKFSQNPCNGACATCPYHQAVCTQEVKGERRIAVFSTENCPPLPNVVVYGSRRWHFIPIRVLSDLYSVRPDLVLYRSDALRREESLFPLTKMMDIPIRTLVTVERYGTLRESGHSLDVEALSRLIGMPVVTADSHTEEGLRTVLKGLDALLYVPKRRIVRIDYGHDIEKELVRISPDRFTALRLLEKENYILPYLGDDHEDILRRAQKSIARLERQYHCSSAELIKGARRSFISGALQETLIHGGDHSDHSFAQRVDALLTSRITGLPILVVLLCVIFECTFALGAYPQAWIEAGVDALDLWLSAVLPAGWLSSLLTDGIIQGCGAVISFLPNIVILFFFLSLLEDSGYMSRAAFLLDKLMHRIGLHGKSFIPMMIGFGCNVPAIMAARDIEDRKDRMLTMLMIPYMSCSARLPVYLLLVSAFFPKYKALAMMGIYLLGVLLSIAFALVMKRTKWFRKEDEDYVSQLPDFQLPTLHSISAHIWERTADYLQKITTVILAASVVIWALEYFPRERPADEPYAENSALALTGKAIHPVLEPLGFDWKMSVCLLTGLPAKEAIVSTMGILYAPEESEDKLVDSLQQQVYPEGARKGQPVFTPAVALSFMAFVLLYFPCFATIGALSREAGRKWAAFSVVHSLTLAWVVAFLVFRLALLF